MSTSESISAELRALMDGCRSIAATDPRLYVGGHTQRAADIQGLSMQIINLAEAEGLTEAAAWRAYDSGVRS